jgi:muramidase (phage lysozyme)
VSRLPGLSPNLSAFLDVLAFSEGTSNSPTTQDDGYDQIVGRTRFTSYATHPNKLVRLPRLGISSTAAGRYQLLARYWIAYKARLHLSDFSPESQDRIAIQQIRERKALPDIEAGYFDHAVHKVRNIWASLPGAGYGQHEHGLPGLRAVYLQFGGKLA